MAVGGTADGTPEGDDAAGGNLVDDDAPGALFPVGVPLVDGLLEGVRPVGATREDAPCYRTLAVPQV
ncbi:hypothetical protein SAMN05444000_12511 [Shimia gijangensis]|uniref:Uncharacterized protein n=1 Tax=Shimia gijangensis TaxID=1470563 RepID=A0A1M6RE30_9RHOB|nr:hypothetical protein [Shimia gijangensis]SHK30745.1 hypothetical protein SAMN05444000_12511 [Shimia gijangensis]